MFVLAVLSCEVLVCTELLVPLLPLCELSCMYSHAVCELYAECVP